MTFYWGKSFIFVIHSNFTDLDTLNFLKKGKGVLFCVLFALFSEGNVSAQENKKAPRSEGYWLAYFGDNKINKIVGIHSELQLRSFFVPDNVGTVIARVGVNFYIKPFITGTVGYGYIFSLPENDEIYGARTSENRIWEQMLFRQKTKAVFMEHRFRLEQRFVQNLSTQSSSVSHRIRYRFQTLFPLYTISPHLRHLFVSVNDEIMLNFKSEPAQIFDRNRFYAGLGYQVSPKLNIQLGYLNQFANVSFSTRGHVDHVVQLSVAYNMDDLMQTFFKKKQDK